MSSKFLKVISLSLVMVFMMSLVACGTSTTQAESKSPENAETTAAAATEAPAETVKLKIYTQYSSDDEKQPFDYAVEKMKTIMPNVELELEIAAQDDNQKIKTYAASGNLPDIFNATTDKIKRHGKSKGVATIRNVVAP